MPDFQTAYQPFQSIDDEDKDCGEINAFCEKAERWSHVNCLDTFMSRVYYYHLHGGYKCISLALVWNVIKFIFVVLWSAFLLYCVDYKMLYHDKEPNVLSHQNSSFVKISIHDIILPVNRWTDEFGIFSWILAIIVCCYFSIQVVRTVYLLSYFAGIKYLFTNELLIPDNELVNVTWHTVQKRLLKLQKKLQISVNSQRLTEIDIYHRILRFQNYMVAMVNKSVLPTKHKFFSGERTYFTYGIKLNIECLLFLSPWSPFAKVWELNKDYKDSNKKIKVTNALKRQITILAIVNLTLFPVIFLWQILHFFYEYAVKIRWNVSALTARHWSISARLLLRHFNELDHELDARLNRGYRFANKYMSSFSCPVTTVNAQNISALIQPVLAILLVLTMYDEDVIQVQGVLGIVTGLSMLFFVCNAAIPDKNAVHYPEVYMTAILSEIHYMPEHWWGKGHTTQVRDEFGKLFPTIMISLIEELLSPILCPFYLFFCLRPQASEIVDFFRLHTIQHFGTGDVCSYALLDIRKHGHPQWAGKDRKMDANENAAEGGKAELSLMHFTMANPEWKPNHESTTFLTQLNEQSNSDVIHYHVEEDLINVPSFSRPNRRLSPTANQAGPSTQTYGTLTPMTECLSMAECLLSDDISIVPPSLRAVGIHPLGNPSSVFENAYPLGSFAAFEVAARNMSFSALYLHARHHKDLRYRPSARTQSSTKQINEIL